MFLLREEHASNCGVLRRSRGRQSVRLPRDLKDLEHRARSGSRQRRREKRALAPDGCAFRGAVSIGNLIGALKRMPVEFRSGTRLMSTNSQPAPLAARPHWSRRLEDTRSSGGACVGTDWRSRVGRMASRQPRVVRPERGGWISLVRSVCLGFMARVLTLRAWLNRRLCIREWNAKVGLGSAPLHPVVDAGYLLCLARPGIVVLHARASAA